ncbi:phosphinothricin acetyltransferase [Melghiribacillus thermohalophilus]|uniref:Phosphinothricin acetyltransferase n=2 Tax=Melghiribacillus thermohalophilus TaxID=1324956 RepID=A0A4R3MNA7_9BACI|nr:phosphinothricin acetyltransferase [Melghiribacillus thermohalophilus]
MIIREAQEQDFKAILNIMNFYIQNTTYTFTTEIQTMEKLTRWYHQLGSRYPFLVADLHGVIAGYAYLSPYRPKEAYQHTAELTIYLDRAYQGKGVGGKLMKAILDQAAERNFHTVISVITSDNRSSIAFHKRFGFQYAGELKEVGYKKNSWISTVYYQWMSSRNR